VKWNFVRTPDLATDHMFPTTRPSTVPARVALKVANGAGYLHFIGKHPVYGAAIAAIWNHSCAADGGAMANTSPILDLLLLWPISFRHWFTPAEDGPASLEAKDLRMSWPLMAYSSSRRSTVIPLLCSTASG